MKTAVKHMLKERWQKTVGERKNRKMVVWYSKKSRCDEKYGENTER